jgi:hypothetical protein
MFYTTYIWVEIFMLYYVEASGSVCVLENNSDLSNYYRILTMVYNFQKY